MIDYAHKKPNGVCMTKVLPKSLPKSFDSIFRHAALPFLFSGSVLFAGCSTVQKTELNLGTCNYKETFSTVVGVPDKNIQSKDEKGTTITATINGFNFNAGSEKNYSAGEACETSKAIVRAGVLKNEKGDYNLSGLALLHVIYTRKDIDPTLKYMIAQRTKANFGFTPEEIPSIAKAQRERNNPQPLEQFTCQVRVQGLRRCAGTSLQTEPALDVK